MKEVHFAQEDVREHRIWAGIGYLVFFVPLIKNKASELCRFCANQGLLLLIIEVIVSALFSVLGGIPLLGWLFELVGGLLKLAIGLFGLLLMIQLMANDKTYELPFIGHLRLIR